MARSRVKTSVQKIAAEISLKIEKDSRRRGSQTDRGTGTVAKEVQEYWKTIAWHTAPTNHGPGVHPYDTRAYVESIVVRQNRSRLGRFLSAYTVVSESPNANFIEFGTGPDKPGSRSPWGPNTPTPAMHPAGRTALFFGGKAP